MGPIVTEPQIQKYKKKKEEEKKQMKRKNENRTSKKANEASKQWMRDAQKND